MNSKKPALDSTTLIAFCGIDGVGKTTLLNALAEELPSNDTIVAQNDYALIRVVESLHRRGYGDGRDWLEGSFAQSIAVGGCFDFLLHYDKRIRPFLGIRKYILCDRYELCYRAYLGLVGAKFDPDDLFANVRCPDVIVYVDASDAVLPSRYGARGGASESETIELARAFRTQYQQLVPKVASKVVAIQNDGNIEHAINALKSELRKCALC